MTFKSIPENIEKKVVEICLILLPDAEVIVTIIEDGEVVLNTKILRVEILFSKCAMNCFTLKR